MTGKDLVPDSKVEVFSMKLPSHNTQTNPSRLDESAQALEEASQTLVRRAGFMGGSEETRKKF